MKRQNTLQKKKKKRQTCRNKMRQISLLYTEVKIIIIRMLPRLEREFSENFNTYKT